MCRWILAIFSLLYALALLVWLAGTWGWFGVGKDPLSGVFLILLGQPWVRLVDYFPEPAWPVASALAPAANLLVVAAICSFLRRNPARHPSA